MQDEKNLRKRQVFDHAPQGDEPPIRKAQHYDDREWHPNDDESASSAADIGRDLEIASQIESKLGTFEGLFVQDESKARPRWSLLAKLAIIGMVALLLTEAALTLNNAWLESPYLFGLYLSVTVIVCLWAGRLGFNAWRKLKKLKYVEEEQQIASRLSVSMQMGEADGFINNILAQLPENAAVSRYLATAKDEHNDAEKLILFEDLVLNERDTLAKKLVLNYATESALLLAASPLAILDMAIILWRNQSMIYKIAQCYGIELGYWSRIKLWRGIFTNIAYAGASELVTDLGTQLLSVEMSGRLSARLGQGLGGGLLTARLGYQAMALCRPIKFQEKSRPKLSRIYKDLLFTLKELSSSVLKGAGSKTRERNKDFAE